MDLRSIVLLLALLSFASAYGTLFANRVVPQSKTTTTIPKVIGDEWTLNGRAEIGQIAATNPNGFTIQSAGPIGVNVAGAVDLSSSLDTTISSTKTTTLSSTGSLSLQSTRIRVDSKDLTTVTSSGAFELQSEKSLYVQGANITSKASAGGLAVSSTSGSISVGSGGGFTFQSQRANLVSQNGVDLRSSASLVALESSTTFVSNSNYVDFTGRIGAKLTASKTLLANAFAVVEATGDQFKATTSNDVLLSTGEKDIRVEAATTASFNTGKQFTITATNGATIKTTSDSESNILLRSLDLLDISGSTGVALTTTDPASSVIFNTAAATTFTADSFSLTAPTQSISVANGLAVKTLGSTSLTSTKNNVYVKAGSGISFLTEKFGPISVLPSQDLLLRSGVTSIVGGTVSFDAAKNLQLYTLTSTAWSATTSLTLSAPTSVFEAGVFSVSSPNTKFAFTDISITSAQFDPIDFVGTSVKSSGATLNLNGQNLALEGATVTMGSATASTSFTSTAGPVRYASNSGSFTQNSVGTTYTIGRDYLLDAASIALTGIARDLKGNTVNGFGGFVTIDQITTADFTQPQLITNSNGAASIQASTQTFTVTNSLVMQADDEFQFKATTAVDIKAKNVYWKNALTTTLKSVNDKVDFLTTDAIRFVSGGDISFRSQLTALESTGSQVQFDASQFGLFKAGTQLTVSAPAGPVSITSGLDFFARSGAALKIEATNGPLSWTSGSVLRTASSGTTLIKAETSVTQQALQTRVEGTSLDIKNTNSGTFLLESTGVDATLSIRAGAALSSFSSTFHNFQGERVLVESYADGSVSLQSAGDVQYSTELSKGSETIRQAAKQTELRAQKTVSTQGFKTTFTANKATSTSTQATTFTASGTLTVVGADVSFASTGAATVGTLIADTIVMTGNPIKWTSTAATTITSTAGEVVFTSGGLTTISAGGAAGTVSKFTSNLNDITYSAGRTVEIRTVAGTTPTISLATAVGNTSPVTIASADGNVDLSAGGALTLLATGAAPSGEVVISASGSFFGASNGGMSVLSHAVDATDGSGIRLLTSDADGDIVVQSYLGTVAATAATSFTVTSNDYLRNRATGSVTVNAKTGLSAISNTGALEMHGDGGFDIRAGSTADNTLQLISTGAQLYQAENTIKIAAIGNVGTPAKDVTFNSAAGALRFGTANNKNIAGKAVGDINFTAAKIFSTLADNALSFTSGAGYTVTAATDVFITTLGGPISMQSTDGLFTITTNTGNATFASGGDLKVVTLSGDQTITAGTLFSATAIVGDGQLTSTGTVQLNSALSGLYVTADGERNLPQDGVAFSSTSGILVQSTDATGAVNFNAENLFAIGRQQRPNVEFWGAGSASQLGWTLNSGGNIDITVAKTLAFKAATVQSISARNYLELSSDTSVSVTAVGAPARALRNVDIKATVGSVKVRGGVVASTATNRLTATSTQHGITINANSAAAADPVLFQANNGMLEFNSKQLDLDTLAFTGTITNLANWKATNGIALTSTAGNGGVITFASTGSINTATNGAIAIRTLLANADVSITATGGTGVQLVASGSSGSPVVLAAGGSTSIGGATIDISGATGVYVQADDTSGNDLAGDITFTTSVMVAKANKHADLIGGNEVLLATRPLAGVVTPTPITLAASRNIQIESNDDSNFFAASHAFTTTIGSVYIFTTQDGQGDVRFAADKNLKFSMVNEEAMWETQGNFFGNVLGNINFVAKGERDNIGLLLSSNGNKAETVLRSAAGSVKSSAADAMLIRSGSTPDNALYNVAFYSSVGGDVKSGGKFLMYTTNNRGDISIKADAAEVSYSVSDFTASAGVDVALLANGAQSVYKQIDAYGIRATAATQLQVQATNGTVSMHAGDEIRSLLTGKLSFSANTVSGKSTGVNSGISFDSTGPSAALKALSLKTVAMAAKRDFSIEATDAAGGIASMYSSGSVAFSATLNMDFSNVGGVGSILVATGTNSGYSSRINIAAPENFAVSSNLRARVAAEDQGGANIRVHSLTDEINVDQYGLSANGLGIELRANDGDVTLQAQGAGSIVLSAVNGLAARAVNAVDMVSSGAANAVKINGGQLSVRTQRGDLAVKSAASISFTASADIDLQTNGLTAGDITATFTGNAAVATKQDLALGSKWGDARFEASDGASVVLTAPIVAVDATGHLAIPFENRQVPFSCNTDGQLARFTGTGIVPSLLGLSPQRPTPIGPNNMGRLCVCFGGSWRCVRFQINARAIVIVCAQCRK